MFRPKGLFAFSLLLAWALGWRASLGEVQRRLFMGTPGTSLFETKARTCKRGTVQQQATATELRAWTTVSTYGRDALGA